MFEHLVNENITICLKWKGKLILKHLIFASSLRNNEGVFYLVAATVAYRVRMEIAVSDKFDLIFMSVKKEMSLVNYQCLKQLCLDIDLKFILTVEQ